jgi:hypothetical protein
MMRFWVSVMSAAIVAVLLAGCGGGQSVPQAKSGSADAHKAGTNTPTAAPSSATHTPNGPSADDVTRYFAALASENPSKQRRVFKLTASGSIAEAYIKEQYGVTLALQQSGQSLPPTKFTHTGDTYKSCQKAGAGQGKSCVTWGNIQAKGNRIANFTVNGKSLKSRLSVGSGKYQPVGSLGKVRVLASYQSVQSGALFVVFTLKSRSHPLSIDQTDSAYLTRSGTQVSAAEVEGPDKLLPHAKGLYYIAFAHTPVGGKLVLRVIDMQNYSDASAAIPTT